MTEPRARLTRLIELATQSAPEKQRALAFELCDLLLEWPARYPEGMREPFEALLEKVLRRLDGTTRRMIAGRLARRADAAIALLNEIYLDVSPEARTTILRRNAERDNGPQPPAVASDETPLLDAARSARGAEFAAALARFLQIPAVTAKRIVDDATGDALAVACKGARVRRATFSALVLLTAARHEGAAQSSYARLGAFDDIPQGGAERLLQHWRQPHEDHPPLEPDVEAA